MIPFIDLHAQRQRLGQPLEDAILKVVRSGAYVMGPEIGQLEAALRDFGQAPFALTCGSGTEALVLPLMAWENGPGDAVFCPSFTFAATAEVMPLVGASPVFVDVLPDTYNIDPAKLEAAIHAVKAAGELTPRAIIAVDLFGQPADYPALAAIAAKHGLSSSPTAPRGSAARWTATTLCTGPMSPRPPSSRPSHWAATAMAAQSSARTRACTTFWSACASTARPWRPISKAAPSTTTPNT